MQLLFVCVIFAFSGLGAFAQDSKNSTGQDLEFTLSSRVATCSCGARHGPGASRIVGGIQSLKNEFTYRAALFNRRSFGSSTYRSFTCSATILNDRWILTAAHCVRSTGSYSVSVGDHNLKNRNDPDRQMIDVDKVHVHSGYNSRTVENDIALLRLAQPIKTNAKVGPVCLPYKFRNKAFTTEKVTASGWGSTGTGKTDAGNTLLKADLYLISNQQCQRSYPRGMIKNTMICAYRDGFDSCQGDSGSGIDYYDPATARYFQLGIVSFGKGCAQKGVGGVYTRVTSYLDWIKQTSGTDFCYVP